MPWQAPAVGVLTHLGYAYCTSCAATREAAGSPIWGDEADGSDSCDQCKKPFERVKSADYVKVS